MNESSCCAGRRWGIRLCAMGLVFPAWLACAAALAQEDVPPVLAAEHDELVRSMGQLQKQAIPPYFLSYQIVETRSANVTASFGALTASTATGQRLVRVDARVGDRTLDNTRSLRSDAPDVLRFSAVPVPLEDSPGPIRMVLWSQTDSVYKRAVEEFERVRTRAQVQVDPEDASADFSTEQGRQGIEPVTPLDVNRALWEGRVRKYSAPFRRASGLYDASATLTATQDTRWFSSSEGAAIQTSQTYYRLFITASSKADDGMELPAYESYFSYTPEGLPDDAKVLRAVDAMIQKLAALRQAPVIEPYTGPAILSGRAAAVFFHEVFGHRIEGHRQKSEREGQTFTHMVGQRVLPDFLSVVFDPTLRHYAGTDLAGAYGFDDEGVQARRVTAVDAGVLTSFLMSRSPVSGFPVSNGHGRAQPGFRPVARQSNLMVLNSHPVSHAELERLLIEQLHAQGKPYGLLFEDIEGGFTLTQRVIPNAFNVIPLVVYRVYPDGRKELVRGVDLIGTPLTVFGKILAADDQTAVFNGFCGAESGVVPVSASAPAILVSEIEVQKKAKSQDRAPILPAPRGGGS
jgi:TldD protein